MSTRHGRKKRGSSEPGFCLVPHFRLPSRLPARSVLFCFSPSATLHATPFPSACTWRAYHSVAPHRPGRISPTRDALARQARLPLARNLWRLQQCIFFARAHPPRAGQAALAMPTYTHACSSMDARIDGGAVSGSQSVPNGAQLTPSSTHRLFFFFPPTITTSALPRLHHASHPSRLGHGRRPRRGDPPGPGHPGHRRPALFLVRRARAQPGVRVQGGLPGLEARLRPAVLQVRFFF